MSVKQTQGYADFITRQMGFYRSDKVTIEEDEMEESYLGTNDSAKLNGGKSRDPRFKSSASHIDYHHRQTGGHMKSGGSVDQHRYQVAKKLGYKV